MRALARPAEGAGMACVPIAQRAQASHTPFAHLSSIEPTRVDAPFMPSTAQVYLKKSRARHVREHGEHLRSPLDPAEPAGAAGDALGDFLFTRGQVLTAVVLLLLASDAREALAARTNDHRV